MTSIYSKKYCLNKLYTLELSAHRSIVSIAIITPRSKDYSQWYVDLILQAKLADYSPIKGCMIIRPNGYAIWERMQTILDKAFKEVGVQNAYFPLLIPQSFMEKEKEHVKGFSPECAIVTHASNEKLHEPLVLRPTSETIIWSMYKKWIQSWRDLPLILNQWANVIRWEKRTRLFLRTTEFLWQEGHTAHTCEEEAQERTLQMLNVYANFAENIMAMPVIMGKKSENEKFSGAVSTYSIESMMQDKKALQAGTTHNLGQNFARAFEVQYQDKQGKLQYVWATSWGVSTRLIGALIMTHSDDRGLILPPKIAPIDIAIIPIFRSGNMAKVLNHSQNLANDLKEKGFHVFLDDDENSSPGFKFANAELSGIPVRIEIGERDIDQQSYILVRRDTLEKQSISQENLIESLKDLLITIQNDLYKKALNFRQSHTHFFTQYKDLYDFYHSSEEGFVEGFWCGESECELKIKEKTKATIRNLPLHLNKNSQKGLCIVCQKSTSLMAIWGRSY